VSKKTSSSRSSRSAKAAGKSTGKSAARTTKTTKKKVAKSGTAAPKSVAKKKTSKTAVKKKASTKKTAKKATVRKAARTPAKKTAATAKKKAAKKTAKKAPAKKKSAKKTPAKKTVKKAATKSPAKQKAGATPAAASSGTAASSGKESAGGKGRKGITIVPEKPRRPPRRSRPKAPETRRPVGSQLLGPGSPKRSPLIPSGPKAPKAEAPNPVAGDGTQKSPFKKRELDKFRNLLITKRRALVGDVSQLETEALRNSSGGSSNTPQHMAEQGSDSADQSLSLGLAAADRRLIKEIDAALQRIDEGRFGICELSGRPIRAERLKELPWARYSIEAARQRERNMFRGNW